MLFAPDVPQVPRIPEVTAIEFYLSGNRRRFDPICGVVPTEGARTPDSPCHRMN
jgi:hypothetical protein